MSLFNGAQLAWAITIVADRQLKPLILVSLGLLVLAICYYSREQLKFFSNLPPGPPSWPVFGYLPGLPDVRSWEVYNRWAEMYGDVIHVPSFRNHTIILNSEETINDLLERRGCIYSDRPHMVMFHELMDLGRATTFAPFGSKKWKYHRKIYHQQMGNATAVKKFRDYQSHAARDFLRNLLDSPEDYLVHSRTFGLSITANIAYGHQLNRQSDEVLSITEVTSEAFAKATQPGFYTVDNFPILRHVPSFFPFASFKTYASEVRENVARFHFIPFRRVIEQMRKGTARPSFVSDSLSELDGVDFIGKYNNETTTAGLTSETMFDIEAFESRQDVIAIRDLANGICDGGTAIVTPLIGFILAMVVYPEVQQRAQKELDHVLGFSNNGTGRLPTFEDLDFLPYINATIKEVIRWFPGTPTGFPHATTQEDTYKGYRIPKGTIVLPNIRNLLHDSKTYINPTEFRPERFLPNETGNVEPEPTVAFGFGRRVCPGRHLGETSMWIAFASILAVFDIKPALDKNGKSIDVRHAFEGARGLLDCPQPFKCNIRPRSERARKLILGIPNVV